MSAGEAAAADFLLDLMLVLWLGLVIGAAFVLPLRWARRRRGGGDPRIKSGDGLPAEWGRP